MAAQAPGLFAELPPGAALYGDKAYNDAQGEGFLALEGLRLAPIHKVNMPPHAWADECDLARYRHVSETVNSQRESMGVEHLCARTNAGFDLKVHASLIALWHTQMLPN